MFRRTILISSIFVVSAAIALVVSIGFFGTLLLTCSGHPPVYALGVWIFPVSIAGCWAFFQLAAIFWKSRHGNFLSILLKSTRMWHRGLIIFLVSFLVSTVVLLGTGLVSGLLESRLNLSNWVSYSLRVIVLILTIFSGLVTYRILSKYLIKPRIRSLSQ